MNTSTGNLLIALKATFKHEDWSLARRRNAKLVYIAIATYADDKGKAWPSYETIAEKFFLSRRNVHRALKDLIDKEYLSEVSSKKTSNVYIWHNREHIVLDKPTEAFAASVDKYKPPRRLEKEVGAGSAGPVPTRTRTILEDLLDTSWADKGANHDKPTHIKRQ